MSSLAQRISDTQARIVENSDALQAHLEKMDSSNVSDADMETTKKFNEDLARDRRLLAMLEESEKQLGTTARSNDGNTHRQMVVHGANGSGANAGTNARTANGGGDMLTRVFDQAAEKKAKSQMIQDCVIRAGVIAYMSKVFGRDPEEMRQKIIAAGYSAYADEHVRETCDLIVRAAVNPAQTTVTGWAAELVQTSYGAYMDLLYPQSIFPRLSAKGMSLNFGRAGKIIIPTRSATPTIAGSFVGEGLPIPVRQGAFATITLTPKKLAVISTMTREITEHSIPAIEGIIRDAIQTDTGIAIDSVLIDSNPATVVRPAGLLNGVTPVSPTAGGGVAAVVGDVKALTAALITATRGNIRTPVYLMNPNEVNTLIWTYVPQTGAFPFRDEVKAGNLGGVPIIDSGTVPVKTVIVVDAADFVTAGADAPMFNVSDTATIHEEDTTPLPIASPGTPATVAAPVRSLWQTDSIGIRMIMQLNWVMRRPSMVQAVQNVSW